MTASEAPAGPDGVERPALAPPPAAGSPSGTDVLDTARAGPVVIRGGALRAGGYVLGIALTVASTPLLIRHLGVADYGRYLTVVSLIFIVAGLTEAGLTNIGVREYAEREGNARDRVVGNLLGLRVTLTFAGVACATLFAAGAGYTSAQVVGCVLAGIGLAVAVAYESYVVPLSVRLRLGLVTATEVVRQIGTVVGIVALVAAGAALVPFFAVPIFASLAALTLTVWLVRGHVDLRPSFDVREWWIFVRDALPYAAATALGIVYFRVTVVLMSLVAPPDQVGYFSASFRIVEVLAGIPWLLATSVFPILVRAARDDRIRLRYALGRLLQVAAVLGLWVAIALIVAAPFAIALIAGPSFHPSIAVLQIQAPTLLGSFLMATLGFVLLSLRRHRELLLANLVALALAVGLTLGLSPVYGAKGAAVATVAAEFGLASVYALFLFGRHPELRISPRFVLPIAVAGAVALAAGLLIGLPSLPAAIVTSIVYWGIVVACRAFPGEVASAFLDQLRTLRGR